MTALTLTKDLFSDALSAEEMAELQKYYSDIEMLATKKAGVQFNNEGKNHAAIVMALIFSNAQNHIKIFAGDYNGNVCDNEIYLRNLEEKVSSNQEVRLSVLFEREPKQSKGLALLKKLHNSFPERVSVQIAEPSQLKDYLKKPIHFTIGDESMYRCETDVNTYKAICDFDDSDFTTRLSNLFVVISDQAKNVQFA